MGTAGLPPTSLLGDIFHGDISIWNTCQPRHRETCSERGSSSLHLVLRKASLAKSEGFLAPGLLADMDASPETAPRCVDRPGKGDRSGTCDTSM